jgi:hypothetical protein
VPLGVLIWAHRLGRPGAADVSGHQALKALLDQRPMWQAYSALLLVGAAVVLLCEILMSRA